MPSGVVFAWLWLRVLAQLGTLHPQPGGEWLEEGVDCSGPLRLIHLQKLRGHLRPHALGHSDVEPEGCNFTVLRCAGGRDRFFGLVPSSHPGSLDRV